MACTRWAALPRVGLPAVRPLFTITPLSVVDFSAVNDAEAALVIVSWCSTVPGCIAVRRYHAVEGSPKYQTIYEFEHEKVPETAAWHERHAQDTMHQFIGGTYNHAPGSPGVYRRILPTRAF